MHAEFSNLLEKWLEILNPMNSKVKLLERTYLWILVAILLLIVFTPFIIRSGFSLVQEEIAEVVAIALLFTVGYVVLLAYRKEVKDNRNNLTRLKQDKGLLESRLSEAFRYIGTLNIQIEEIKSAFSEIQKFPENKKDFQNILQFLAERTLSMVNAEWVILRIIGTEDLDTLSESSETRGNDLLLKHKISNRALASNGKFEGLTVVGSAQENFRIKTFCILPKEKLSNEGKIFIRAIVNQLEMLFVIFTSTHYKNSHVKSGDLSPR
jgi:hypothetical protein